MAKQGVMTGADEGDDLDEGAGLIVENDEGETVTLDDDDAGDKGKKGAGKKGKDEGADDEGDDAGSEERLGADPEGESEEEARERKRAERRDKRKRQKQWIQRDRLELGFLRQQNEELERRLAGVEKGQGNLANQGQLTRIDAAIGQLRGRLSEVDSVIADAINTNDGAAVVEAQRTRDQIRDKLTELNLAKRDITGRGEDEGDGREERGGNSEGGRPNLTASQREANRVSRQNAIIFKSRHEWFDGQSKDSRTVNRLDSELRNEGYRYDSSDFWQELEKRLKKVLPHRFDEDDPTDDDDDEQDEGEQRRVNGNGDGDGQRRGAKGGPVISGVGGKGGGKPGARTFHVSAARKQAMVDAGVWEDPVLRNKMLKRYAQYDKDHAGDRSK